MSSDKNRADWMNPETGGAPTMNVKPLADRILVRRLEEQEMKRGGIIIPDTAKEKPQQAEVIAVGPGKITDDGKRVALDVKKGDKILLSKYSGTEVRIGENEYLIVREEEVLAIVGESK
jgi:chaperonin GroES